MKKIASLLTFVLVLALAVPAFAAEDNVEITGDVKTTLEIADYGDEEADAVKLWKDADVLDTDDNSDLPAKKAFFQDIDFGITGNVNEDVTFDLALSTLTNSFTQIDGVYGEPGQEDNLEMDTATLTLADDVSTLKLGDISEFHADQTFINEEDREGLTLDTAVMGTDVSVFALGNDDGISDEEFTGLTAEKDLDAATVTGKVLYADKFVSEGDRFNVTNYVMAADADLTDVVAVNGKVASNNWEQDADTDNNDSDTFMSAGVTVTPIDALTVNGSVEQVGENYKAVMDDTEGANTNKYKVDADYDLNANNTVSGEYTVVSSDADADEEDKSTSKIALDNTMGEFTNTASVEMTTNEEFAKDNNVTLVKLGTEYAANEATTVTADLTNKTEEDANGEELSYNYLKAGVDTEVSENVTWNNEAQYVTGNTKDDVDATANSLTTSLDVSF